MTITTNLPGAVADSEEAQSVIHDRTGRGKPGHPSAYLTGLPELCPATPDQIT